MQPLDWSHGRVAKTTSHLRGSYDTPLTSNAHDTVMFKTVVLVWKCPDGTAPGYLSELCVPVASASGRQRLISALMDLLQVLKARTTTGKWIFAVAGPSLWNSLSAAPRRRR